MWKKWKKLICWKKYALSIFLTFIKKIGAPHKSLHQKNRPKNMHFVMQRFLFHSKFCCKTYKAFLYFNYNRQQYSLFYSLFLYGVWRCFHMFRFTNKTSERNKECRLDKTGEGKQFQLRNNLKKMWISPVHFTEYFTPIWRRFSHVQGF